MNTLQRVSIGTAAVALILGQFAAAAVTPVTTTFNGKTVVSFTGDGTTTWTVPTGVTSVDVLVVGGGGPGGQGGGGGGGAGGLLYYQNQSVTPLTSQAVVVGAGGIGGTSDNQVWTNGGNSSFLGYTAIGGGRGAIGPSGTPWDHHGYGNNPPPAAGSGGGADADRPNLVGPGTPGQGYAGGTGVSGSQYSGGGGGGAGGIGGNSTGSVGGTGGSGLDFSGVFGPIGGDSGWFAGGGGGGVQYVGTGGSVGRGGGGTGAGGQITPATAGTPGTGGGGGASGINAGYNLTNGGSGIVVVIYTPSTVSWDYAAWAGLYAQNQTADLDTDGDGVPNGVEYFMGQTGSSFTPMPPVVNTAGVRTWAWSRDPNAPASFKFQISDTLNGSDWEDVVPPNASINTSDPNQVIYTFGPKRFCRLVVTP